MTDWNKKLAAWLHDPAEKALILMRDAAGHEGGTVARLYQALGLSRADFDPRADHLAAAADRPQWPRREDGGRYQAFERVNFDRQPELVHPLSGRRLALASLSEVSVEAVKAVSFEHLRPLIHPGDPRRTYLAFWRFGPEAGRFAPELGALWSMLPADTRVPDHNIWSHLDTVAALHTALAGDADGPDEPALLAMSFGPVQGFINQARSTSDLWAGSHLLSSLVGEALKLIAGELGPDAVVFPALRGVPAIDRWLVEEGGERFRSLFKEGIKAPLLRDATDTNPLFAASLPNKLVAIVPSRQAQRIAEAAIDQARDKALQWAREAARAVFEAAGATMTADTHAQIEIQLQGFPEAAWAAATWPVGNDVRDIDAAAERVRTALRTIHPALASQGIFAPAIWDVLRRTLPLAGLTFWTPNTGILYPAVYELADRALSAAKAVRPFVATIQHGHRCTLTGEHEWLTDDRSLLDLSRRERSARSVWGKLADQRPNWARRGEHLGAIATLKRVWPTLFADEVGRFLQLPPGQRVRRFVVSTHALAASTSIERLLDRPMDDERRAALRDLTDDARFEQVTLPARIVRKLHGQPPELQQALRRLPSVLEAQEDADASRPDGRLRTLFGNIRPEAYYAVVMMDGDRMGSWIAGNDDAHRLTYENSWHTKVVAEVRQHAVDSPAIARYMTTRRPGSPARHLAISQALNHFSTLLARYVVEDCFKGKLLYAGGDDVLALLAVDDLPATMQLLRLAYSGIAPHPAMGLDEHVGTLRAGGAARQSRLLLNDGFGLLDGRLMQLMGERATASMGAVIAHHTAPLSRVLKSAREAEQQAKASGRDAFCLRVLKRGGGEVTLTSPWWGPGDESPDVGRSALPLLRQLAGELASTDFSRGALYLAQQWFEGLTDRRTDADDPVWRARMAGGLQYQFQRQKGDPLLARRIVDFVCDVVRPDRPRTTLENFLMTGEFLARESRGFGLADAVDPQRGRKESTAA